MQNLTGKITGSSLDATEWNQLPGEVQNVITDLGITLSSGDLNQLGKAIAGYVANGTFYTDSGVADAYVLTQIGSKKAPTAYTDGMLSVFRPGNTNTGACTANTASLGVKSIKTSAGADPAAGALPAGKLAILYYDAANGWHELVPITGFAATSELAALSGFNGLAGSTTGTTATVAMTADEVLLVSASGNPVRRTSVSLSINTAASGANGLDTGTLAASTWYYIYAIWNGTTVAGLISLSATAPTLPGGYTHYRRLGAMRTDGTANKYPLSMTWAGKKARYKVAAGSNVIALPLLASGTTGTYSDTAPTYAALSVSNFMPPSAKTGTFLVTNCYNSGTSSNIVFAPNNSYSGRQSTNPPPIFLGAAASGTELADFPLESANVYAACGVFGAVGCYGWEE